MAIIIGFIISMIGGAMVGWNSKNYYAIVGLALALLAQIIIRL